MEPVTNTAKPKAKIKFCKFENALAMQVLYMDERFRISKEKEYNIHKLDGQVSVVSDCEPDIEYDCIYLWGYDKDYDKCLVIIETNEEIGTRVNSLMDIIEALKDWAKNWEGWKDEPAIEPKITEYDGGVVMVEV